MILTRSQFKEKIANNDLKIAFVGMSNIGKSHWSKALVDEKGFVRYEVDGAIQDKLQLGDMDQAAKWMGYPFEDRYLGREKEYLDLENDITATPPIPENKNFVLDTTGSAVYLEEDTLAFLRENFLIIEFDASDAMVREMTEDYFITPKSVVWNGDFDIKEGENGIDALRRCYPSLLHNRVAKYRKLGDVLIPGEFTRTKGLSFKRFWEVLYYSLPQ